MTISRPDFAEVRRTMVELFRAGPAQAEAFDRVFTNLISRGWTRRDVDYLTRDVLGREAALDEAGADDLYEFYTGLIGHCSPTSILRFPGEPEDQEELTAWVRGNKWR
jgi:hypothetical protein